MIALGWSLGASDGEGESLLQLSVSAVNHPAWASRYNPSLLLRMSVTTPEETREVEIVTASEYANVLEDVNKETCGEPEVVAGTGCLELAPGDEVILGQIIRFTCGQ